jgi:hypothetical protein
MAVKQTVPYNHGIFSVACRVSKDKALRADVSQLSLVRMGGLASVIMYKKWKLSEMERLEYDKDKAGDQTKIILSDWKGGSWWDRLKLKLSKGGTKEEDRGKLNKRPKK